jgi:hypothetical protein
MASPVSVTLFSILLTTVRSEEYTTYEQVLIYGFG